MQLDLEDRQLISDSLRQICQDLSTRYFPRPEQACEPADFLAAQQLMAEQGILNLGPEPGCGLWENCDDTANLGLTLDNLQIIARSNAALALSLHRSALAWHLLQQLCVSPPRAGAPLRLGLCLHGRHGIGRGELARWWQGQSADTQLLSEVFDEYHPRLTLMQGKDSRVLCPVFAQGSIRWRLCEGIDALHTAHGLDELHYGWVNPVGEKLISANQTTDVRQLSRDIWHREWLGLLAIQAGCVQQALDKAREYSAIRHQGGQMINHHPAVQGLLTDIRAALGSTAAFLNTQTLDTKGFARLLLARMSLQEALNTATNAAMQIFGGIGYMQDAGLEKCFRDVNQLRYQSGGPLDMQLLAANWEEV